MTRQFSFICVAVAGMDTATGCSSANYTVTIVHKKYS